MMSSLVGCSSRIALLLALFGSVAGRLTTAVIELVTMPVVPSPTVPLTVNASWLPAGKFTEPIMLPVAPAGQVAPPLLRQVQIGDWKADGNVSTSVVLLAAAGPALATVIEYWRALPAVYALGVALIETETSASFAIAWQLTTARSTQSPLRPSVSPAYQTKVPGAICA